MLFSSLPPPIPPGVEGSRFLHWGHASVPCDPLFRLRGIFVAAGVPCFSGVRMRGTLSYADWGRGVDSWVCPAELLLRRRPPDLPLRFHLPEEGRS